MMQAAILYITDGRIAISGSRQYSLQNVHDSQLTAQPASVKQKRITKLSFDDYFSQWTGIATTKPASDSINSCKFIYWCIILIG